MKYKSEAIIFLIILIFLLSLCNSIWAQSKPHGGKAISAMPPVDNFPAAPNQLEINKYMDYLENLLKLDPEQKVRLKTIYEDHYRNVDNLRPGYTRIYDDMREKYDELLMELEMKVSSILNETQMKMYDEFLDKQEARMSGREYILEGYIPPVNEECEELDDN